MSNVFKRYGHPAHEPIGQTSAELNEKDELPLNLKV
jgi:hypothetical protein